MIFIYVAVLLLILCGIVFFLIMPAKSTPEQRAQIEGINYAHRGLHNKDKSVPENSMAAFAAAVERGYGIEWDIQLSADGEVVVFHDDTLKRVCGVDGRVDAFPYAELGEMRLHGTDERIPLFSEALALVDGRIPLIVELKLQKGRNKELCEKAFALLKEYKGPYCIESFDPRIVRWFKLNAPEVLRGQLSSSTKSLGGDIKGFAVSKLLTNFLARPHFIAYSTGKKPLTVRIAQKFAMKVEWTVRPGSPVENIERANDAVIFEFYTPRSKYR